MENGGSSEIDGINGQRLAMALMAFAPPMRPAKAFSFHAAPAESNAVTYYADVGSWNMPFKILRSSSAPKPVLMLVHGLGLHPASFRGIAAHLLKVCDLILVDYSGFSARPCWPHGGASLRVLAHAMMRIPAALGLTKINIGGSSLGGGLAMIAAVDFPEHIDRIVLFNPAIFPRPLPSFYKIVCVPILGQLVMRFIPPRHLVCGVTTIGYVNPSHVDHELVQMYHDNMKPPANRLRVMDLIRQLPVREVEVRSFLEHTGKLPQPVLLIWGEQDRLLASDTGRRLSEALPHNEFHSFADLSHLPHEESPDRIGPIVAKFIAASRSR
jgi:pimeloyl-ACP methyl ester carboxylesterase